MTPQELKSSILQLAIQGKLVEQSPDEGTGEELYRQIQAEKQALIKAGKIKKEKPLPEGGGFLVYLLLRGGEPISSQTGLHIFSSICYRFLFYCEAFPPFPPENIFQGKGTK